MDTPSMSFTFTICDSESRTSGSERVHGKIYEHILAVLDINQKHGFLDYTSDA